MSEKRNYFNATRIAMIALFGALAGILYSFVFPIAAAFPVFLELNFSDIPMLIGTFALGPLSGGIIVVIKILIKLIIKSTGTAFVGELADLLIGLAFIVPAGLIYQKKRSFKSAMIGMCVGMFSSVAVAVFVNWIILVPFYIQLVFHGSWDPLIGMMLPLFPSCTKDTFYNFYLWVSVLPFNFMRCLIAIIVTLPVYKHISRAIVSVNKKLAPKKEATAQEARKRTVITVLVCVAVFVLLIGFALLRYFLKK